MSEFQDKYKLSKEERSALHDAVLDKGIEVTTLGVVGSGAATAVGEVMHVATGGVLWGHLTGTMMALFHGAVALDVTFIGYRLYRMLKSQSNQANATRDLRLKEVQIDQLISEVQSLRDDLDVATAS